jgi:hypothetical protein
MHHNWYDDGVKGRQPRVRFGHVHLYNNYWNSNNTDYCIGTGKECHVRLENCHFDNVDDPWADYGDNSKIGWKNILFEGCSQPTYLPNSFPTFTPPYSFRLDPVEDVESIVRAGAGNVFDPTGNDPHGTITPPLDNVVINLNPVSNNLTLVLNGSHFGNMRIALYNCLGKLVMAENVNEKENILPIGHVSKGLYLVCLESIRGNMTRKIIIE